MTVEQAVRELRSAFEDLDVVEGEDGDHYFYYYSGVGEPDRRMPFATIVSSDRHDTASHLDRPGVFRVNVSAGKAGYERRFGPLPRPAEGWGVVDTGHDYGRLDHLMPHPIYAPMGWVCVLNPGEDNWREVLNLATDAHAQARRRQAARLSRR